MASPAALCDVNDLRYQLFRVMKGDVDSGQFSHWKFNVSLFFMLCGLIIKSVYGKDVLNKK